MISRISAFRHSQAGKNTQEPSIVAGQSLRSPLTLHGLGQSAQLGLAFRRQERWFTAARSSSADRAFGTGFVAFEVAGLVDVELVVDDRLLEISQGAWEGRDRTQPLVINDEVVEETYPRLLNRGLEGRVWGGQSVLEVGKRMLDACIDVGQQHPGEEIALFTHGVALRCAVALLRNDFAGSITQRIPHCSETLITYDPARPTPLQLVEVGRPMIPGP